ncbi:hypothetical protein Tco_1377219 [Tanacetum coccineum]
MDSNCLIRLKASILVNGEFLRRKFQFYLQMSKSKLSSSLNISHLFYADDAIFLGQWNDSNIDTLVHVMECFYRVSGLRINLCKSKIMGIHVDADRIKSAASKLGCLVLNTPFLYLVGSKNTSWWNVDYVDVSSYEEWYTWLVSLRLLANLKLSSRHLLLFNVKNNGYGVNGICKGRGGKGTVMLVESVWDVP